MEVGFVNQLLSAGAYRGPANSGLPADANAEYHWGEAAKNARAFRGRTREQAMPSLKISVATLVAALSFPIAVCVARSAPAGADSDARSTAPPSAQSLALIEIGRAHV